MAMVVHQFPHSLAVNGFNKIVNCTGGKGPGPVLLIAQGRKKYNRDPGSFGVFL